VIKNLTITLLFLLVLGGCGESSIPANIVLSCSCIESESSNDICTYGNVNPEVKVNFETNSMSFGGMNYKNLGTTPTSFSVRDKSDFVVLNRGNLRLTFDHQSTREIYQCYENKI
jgi:hypothetical protein